MRFHLVAQRLVDFVLQDPQFKSLGVRGGAERVYRDLHGRSPLANDLDQIVSEFWQVWHERFDDPQSSPATGARSPWRVREDMSPAQENAVREMEECGDAA